MSVDNGPASMHAFASIKRLGRSIAYTFPRSAPVRAVSAGAMVVPGGVASLPERAGYTSQPPSCARHGLRRLGDFGVSVLWLRGPWRLLGRRVHLR